MDTLLTIVQKACKKVGQPVPSIVAAGEGTVARMLTLVNEEGAELIRDVDWQALRKQETFATALSGTVQPAVPPSDFDRFTPGTDIWDVAKRRKIIGPMSPNDWMKLQLDPVTGIDRYYIMLGDALNIFPVSGSADTIMYFYQKNTWVMGSGSVPKTSFTADTDVPLIPDQLLYLGLVWRWKSAIGIDYDEAMQDYTRAKEIYIANDRIKGEISLNSSRQIADNHWPGTIGLT